jgi:hypothetical protein
MTLRQIGRDGAFSRCCHEATNPFDCSLGVTRQMSSSPAMVSRPVHSEGLPGVNSKRSTRIVYISSAQWLKELENEQRSTWKEKEESSSGTRGTTLSVPAKAKVPEYHIVCTCSRSRLMHGVKGKENANLCTYQR